MRVRLPFDLRDSDPSKNCGIHGLDVWFILVGPLGASQYGVRFGVYLPGIANIIKGEISGFDVGYHSPDARFEGQEANVCDLLPGGKCFYDGSVLRAEEWTKEIFATKGDLPENVIWPKLLELYREIFDEKEKKK